MKCEGSFIGGFGNDRVKEAVGGGRGDRISVVGVEVYGDWLEAKEEGESEDLED